MKRFEAKNTFLLMLPALALLFFGSLWPLFQRWSNSPPRYELLQYEVRREKSPFPVDRNKAKGETLALHAHVKFSHRTTLHTWRRLGNRRPMDYYRIMLNPRCLVKGKLIQPFRQVWLSDKDQLRISMYYDVGRVQPSEVITFGTTLRYRDGFPDQELPVKKQQLKDF